MAEGKKDQPDAPVLELETGWDDWGKEEPPKGTDSERPTVAPSFDLEAFAKERGVSSMPMPRLPPKESLRPAPLPTLASEPFSQRKTPPQGSTNPRPVGDTPRPAAYFAKTKPSPEFRQPPKLPAPGLAPRPAMPTAPAPTVAAPTVPAPTAALFPTPRSAPRLATPQAAVLDDAPVLEEVLDDLLLEEIPDPAETPRPDEEVFERAKAESARGTEIPDAPPSTAPASIAIRERPTTVRIREETLLALANKVAGSDPPAVLPPSVAPRPATPPPPEEEDPFAALAEELREISEPLRPSAIPAPVSFDDSDDAPKPPSLPSPPPSLPTPSPPPTAPAPAGRPTPVAIPAAGGAAVLLESAEPPEEDPFAEMRDRFALGDYSGALVMAESLLDENPAHSEALEYAESCRTMLTKMYTARIGPLERVPLVEVERDQLRWLSIDHRAGFVLSLVDGMSSLEMILDVSGMRELDALRILYELVQQRIIAFR